MDYRSLIGLEVADAERVLIANGINDFKFVYYTDRKQQSYDRELVTAVRCNDGKVEIVVCRYLFEVQ